MNTTELYEIWSIQPGIMFIIRVRMLCLWLCFVSDICMKKVPGVVIISCFFILAGTYHDLFLWQFLRPISLYCCQVVLVFFSVYI